MQSVKRTIVKKNEQYKALTQGSTDPKRRSFLDEPETRSNRTSYEVEGSMQKHPTEYSPGKAFFGEPLGQDRLKNLARENEELLKIMGDQSLTVSHMQDIGG